MENFTAKQCKISGGFAKKRQDLNASATLYSVHNRFEETGRFKALKCEKQNEQTHVYWDSDVAKWIEAAAYLLARKDDEQIRAWYEEAVNDIVRNQLENGYFNSFFQVYAPDKIFTNRNDHELYCAGHIFEAAVSCSKNLNDNRLLEFASKYVDYITERFVIKKDTVFTTPGHEEIELALYKLFKHTGDKKYKTLAEFFIDNRGVNNDKDPIAIILPIEIQSHLPVREQFSAEGHAVRALYLYCAMADLAKENNDDALKHAATLLYENIINEKMYVTGGVGSCRFGEKFTTNYDLDNYNCYSETCASIALTFFSDRMLKLTGESKYADYFERGLYNGVMSGVSLSGDRFFYVNPLEMQLERKNSHHFYGYRGEFAPISTRAEIFSTSCCPPNICRYFEELPEFIWYKDEDNATLTLSQFMESQLTSDFADATIKTDFPFDGKIKVSLNSHGKKITLRIRKPTWCDATFTNEKNGYLEYTDIFEGKTIEIDFPMQLKAIYPNGKIFDNSGKIALSYGPLILCIEGADNPVDIPAIRISSDFIKNAVVEKDDLTGLKVTLPAFAAQSNNDLYTYKRPELKPITATFIPYYAWANRGDNDMRVWVPELR